jgi:flagellar hook assembly protein FlgD
MPVALSVHDVKGMLVKTLFKGQKETGYYTVNWDGKDKLGKEAASGIYLCRLTQGTTVKQIKMFLVR